MKLTKHQRAALQFVARVCNSPEFGHQIDGVHPRRGQTPMFEQLRKMDLLADAGIGVSTENPEQEVQLYVITAKGRAALIPTAPTRETIPASCADFRGQS